MERQEQTFNLTCRKNVFILLTQKVWVDTWIFLCKLDRFKLYTEAISDSLPDRIKLVMIFTNFFTTLIYATACGSGGSCCGCALGKMLHFQNRIAYFPLLFKK